MNRLTVFQTDKGRYSVRPIDWEGIWDKQGRIQESGIHHIAIFEEKEEAEFFAKTKNMEEQGKLLILPCKLGDTVYHITYFGIIEEVVINVIHITKNSYIYFGLTIKGHEGRIIEFSDEQFGKTVFLTEQEVYEALAEMEEVDHEKA